MCASGSAARVSTHALARSGAYISVAEGGLTFLVNFTDYLDTGLFLDHRLTRQRLREAAAGRRFLNLYCYTAQCHGVRRRRRRTP